MSKLTKATFGQNFEKIIQQVRATRKRLSPHSVKICVPGGFPYEAFNNKAFIHPWSIMRMIESSRALMFSDIADDENTLDIAQLYKDRLIFIASTSTTIYPQLYNFTAVKAPLDIRVKLDYVGNTAFKLRTVMYIEGRSEALCENEAQSVFVSNETYQPTPPPGWWKEKYSLGSENGEALKLPRFTVPDNMEYSEYHFRVPASDVDSYMHVNWSNFIKYCHDAFVFTALKKSGLQAAENALHQVKQFSISFINEASLGDSIYVRFWENLSTPDLYHFQFFRESAILGECSIEYYPVEMRSQL